MIDQPAPHISLPLPASFPGTRIWKSQEAQMYTNGGCETKNHLSVTVT